MKFFFAALNKTNGRTFHLIPSLVFFLFCYSLIVQPFIHLFIYLFWFSFALLLFSFVLFCLKDCGRKQLFQEFKKFYLFVCFQLFHHCYLFFVLCFGLVFCFVSCFVFVLFICHCQFLFLFSCFTRFIVSCLTGNCCCE